MSSSGAQQAMAGDGCALHEVIAGIGHNIKEIRDEVTDSRDGLGRRKLHRLAAVLEKRKDPFINSTWCAPPALP